MNTILMRAMRRLGACIALGAAAGAASAQTIDLADRPLFSTTNVPGNLMLALSVEWPTANTPAYLSTTAYDNVTQYLGYYVPTKCYRYVYNSTIPAQSYFAPNSAVSALGTCVGTTTTHLWSGNYLNWVAMQSLDMFRWALTGGDRVVDTTTETILEKTRESNQASAAVFADKTLPALVSTITPFTVSSLVSRGRGMGTQVQFSPATALVSCSYNVNSNRRVLFTCTPSGGTATSCNTANSVPASGGTASCPLVLSNAAALTCTVSRPSSNTYNMTCAGSSVASSAASQSCTSSNINYSSNAANASCSSAYDTADYTGTGTLLAGRNYNAQIRIKACDATGGGVESNCKAYGSNYKPEGLMQEYAMQLRYGAFGYLNDVTDGRDGGVLRARMKSVGPQVPVPGSAAITNTSAEWSTSTGIVNVNPDAADSSDTSADASAAGYTVTVSNSGVINYLNRFGKLNTNTYKSKDPVSEMYYAATRYFRNLGPVATYSSLAGAVSQATLARWIDGFPVIRTWNDPIQYSCQKNFILGIGDVNTHYDTNLPGTVLNSSPAIEPTMPSEVASDGTVNVKTATDMVGTLEGISNLGSTRTGSSSHASHYIAGLAYDAHTKDIRADLNGSQTISTYWMDVREGQVYLSKNQYWLAAKYGGFTVPAGFDPYAATNGTTTLNTGMWTTTGETVGADPRPDNYFIASNAASLVTGLRNAFARIASENAASTSTAFSTTSGKISSGSASYATTYNPRNWTGDVEASEITFNANGVPQLTVRWNAGALLDATLPSSRKIITCCSLSGTALPFTYTDLNTTALAARTYFTSFSNVPGVSSQSATNFVSYLRGDRTQEVGNGGVYRSRTSVLGDIVGSRVLPVGRPQSGFSDQFNAGYSAFKAAYFNRKTVVYVGANDGMLHAFDGALPGGTACTTCGKELFAFIPSFVYGDVATAPTNGLSSLGNPNFAHRYMVDGNPQQFDVDFRNTQGSTATAADWRTVLIGGLGKGGKGYYALDITDPSSWTSESAVAGKFLWEFTDSRMGYTFGEAIVVKTRKYGWTAVVASGYNNSDGVGYLFLINPRTGALLEAIATPEGSASSPINMAHMNVFVPSFRDGTTDAAYAGDLQGNIWRFDLTATSGTYPAPTKIATLTDASGAVQPVTISPLVEIDPASNKRYVAVGTGRLLADTDVNSSQQQTLYVIADGTAALGGFFTPSTLPSGVSHPISRSALNNNATPLTGVGSTPTSAMGWYYDYLVSSNSVAERTNVDLTSEGGAIEAAINLPNGEACNPAGSGRVVSMRLSDGRSVLTEYNAATGTSDRVVSSNTGGVVTNMAHMSVGGQRRLYIGTSGTSSSSGSGSLSPVTATTECGQNGGNVECRERESAGSVLRRLNWREVQTAN